MSTDHEHGLEQPRNSRREGADVSSRAAHVAVSAVVTAAARGSPEGRYSAGPGKPLARQIMHSRDQMAGARARAEERQAAVERAKCDEESRKQHHRGGDRPWMLRLLILPGILAESVTAYVAMEILVTSQTLAIVLATLAAVVGAGMACIFANRRLNNLAVPAGARPMEAIFVAVLTVLRYESLSVQGAGLLAAVGAAALAALISALGLLGIEEVVVETYTLDIFVSALRVSWRSWRFISAAAHVGRLRARMDAAADNQQQHFMDFLLKTEGLSLEEARERAVALRCALVQGDGAR